MNNPRTYLELFEYFQKNDINFKEWVKEPWSGKDKQESTLRLFTGLGLIGKLDNYYICNGNFNKQTIKKQKSMRELFYKERKETMLKDNGDSSDLTLKSKNNEKHLAITTSKNKNKLNITNLDLEKMITNFKPYEENGYTMSPIICTRNNKETKEMLKRTKNSSSNTLDIISDDTIFIDWDDLNLAYQLFKKEFKDKNIEDVINKNNNILKLKFHQELAVDKITRLKKQNVISVLLGFIQRSGKSYIIPGVIIKDSKNKEKCNYIILTTSPNETIEQQYKILKCFQLDGFNIVVLNGKNKKPRLGDKNIIICSKQYLQTAIDETKEKTKNIKWLKDIQFDMRFIDESHNGGTTPLCKKTLDIYGNSCFTVHITATYAKTVFNFNIPKEHRILWDGEDIHFCKNINNPVYRQKLIEKHGKEILDFLNNYTDEQIMSEYFKYPELWVLTDELKEEVVEYIISNTKDNEYGTSLEASFLLKQSKDILREEFQNEEQCMDLWYRIFGKKDGYGIPDKKYPEHSVFMKRIEKICNNPVISSRFIDNYKEPMIIMVFLPQKYIDKISNATIKLFKKRKFLEEDYIIISLNSKVTNNPKQEIENGRIIAKNTGKRGVLVLTGRQCSLGVTIQNCDITILLNNSHSFDMIHQMMYRSMTEHPDKKCGFVIDLNIKRSIDILINYSYQIKPELSPIKGVKYLLEEKLLVLNGDHYLGSFGKNEKNKDKIANRIYRIYSSNIEKALSTLLDRVKYKNILLSKEDSKMFNNIFLSNGSNVLKFKILEHKNFIKDGIKKIEIENNNTEEIKNQLEDTEEERIINYGELLKDIIALICLLTIHINNSSFVEMYEYIENNPYSYLIFKEQIKTQWNTTDEINKKILKKFIYLYKKYMLNDKETEQIIRTVKELFVKNIDNTKELGKLVDQYLIPKETERKKNAEVSTPSQLRQEMLDAITEYGDPDFWKSPKKVFEPCSGKGGFIADIVDRFMEGLKDTIPDKKERYRVILEECIYFSDINPFNIFIVKLLLDPYNEYNLNYNEGNTLELDITKKWGLNGFDAVIGNPPYNPSGTVGTGHTIWQLFTHKSLKEWLNTSGYLVFVHPAGWRKPSVEYSKSKYKDIYNILSIENNLIYLEIHNTKDGMKIFRCGTRYDWYLCQHFCENKKFETIIKDEEGCIEKINLKEKKWIPNKNIKKVYDIFNGEYYKILYRSGALYSNNKNILKNKKDDVYNNTVIHSTSGNVITSLYSNTRDKGHFGKSKLIFSEQSLNCLVDLKGEYGITEHGLAIEIKDEKEGVNIQKCFENKEFKSLIDSCSWSNYQIDWRLFTCLKKDFWKEFIEE